MASAAHRARLTALLLCLALPTAAADLAGVVVKVSDGDSLHLVDAAGERHVIRLLAIDAPELRQPHGRAAQRQLLRLVGDREVSVSWRSTDQSGRRVGVVTRRGRDVSIALLRAGHAWYAERWARRLHVAERAEYAEAEASARAARRGLWRAAVPVPPWEWRH